VTVLLKADSAAPSSGATTTPVRTADTMIGLARRSARAIFVRLLLAAATSRAMVVRGASNATRQQTHMRDRSVNEQETNY
jgi:hypothetical protein